MENVTKNIRWILFTLMAMCVAVPIVTNAQSAPAKEYQVKAAFLFNFTQFIDWPAETFSTPSSPFVIGVVGYDPFDSYLDEIIKGENIKGHPCIVKRFNSIADAKGSHMLFITPAKGVKLSDMLVDLKKTNILTVGEMNNFTKQGGMIGFLTENRKVRIQINLEAAQQADLTVSSKLLRVAEIVSTEKTSQ